VGINIHVYDLSKSSGYDLHEPEWWDWIRYAGDTEFWYCESFEWVYDTYEPTPYDAIHLKRPKSTEEARRWVEDNILDGNKPRLIQLLDNMKLNNWIWLHVAS
jgi:hypothetical protein